MTIWNRTETARFLLERDHYAILTHRRPDGDTLGSAAALCRGLRMLGKTAHILTNPDLSARFAWLHTGLTKDAVAEGDTIVSVDVASPQLIPNIYADLLGHIALRIDHHATATSFTNAELVDSASASCAEVVWDVLMEMGVQPDRDFAEAVYVGLSTDTGCFRYANTTAHTFSVAAECVRVFRDGQSIALSELSSGIIPAGQIHYARLNWKDQVDLIVLTGATTDTVFYGRATITTEKVQVPDDQGRKPGEEGYDPTYAAGDSFDHTSAVGFIYVWGLPGRTVTKARAQKK